MEQDPGVRMLKAYALVVILVAAAGACLVGCAPKFESQGALSIGGAPFRPTVCHVLTSCTGIELSDGTGARLTLTLPPQRLDAFEDITGVPSLTFDPGAGKPPFAASACGSLTLTGEGYHGSGKRAASGRAELSCSGDSEVQGDLKFKGCF